MHKRQHVNNENGFVLVISLLILLILVVLGVAATNTTTLELEISGNEKVARKNFYKAESKAFQGAQDLYDNHSLTPLPDPDEDPDEDPSTPPQPEYFERVFEGVTSGNSLGMDTSRLYDYKSLGHGGDAKVEVGVKIRF